MNFDEFISSDPTLNIMRMKAHAAFDPLWKDKHVSRSGAYAWLQRVLGMKPPEAHIKLFDAEQCQMVIDLVETKGPGTEFWKSWYKPGKLRHSRRMRR